MNKTVLVTGSNGFTGQYIRQLLNDSGYEVVGLVTHNPQVHDVVCDLTDKAKLFELVEKINPQYVMHLAAISFVGHDRPEDFYSINVLGTENLLYALEQCPQKPKKIIVASSANVYGTPDIEKIDESLCPAPVNHYATSKLAMEHRVKTLFDKLPIIITRPFNYTGQGQDTRFVIPKIVEHFKDKKPVIELGNIDVYREFNDVRDIAKAYVTLMESTITSEVFNCCSGISYSLQAIIDLMQEISGHTIEIKINPAFVRKNEIKHLAGSNQKLKIAIGYEPEYTIKETLEAMYFNRVLA